MIYYTKNNLIKYYYSILSKNPNLTEEFILKHPNKSWDIEYLIKNNKITDFNALSKFKNINQTIIDEYSSKHWNWEWLIENTNIHVEEYIPLNLIKKYSYKWYYYYLSKNPDLTEKFILKYPNKKWNIEYLIKNNKITNFKSLSKFKNIDQYIIDEYPSKQWDWIWLIENTNIIIERHVPFNLIEKYPYKNWNIFYLIENNKITNFKALTKFKNISQFIINKYRNKPWDWEWIIENTDIDVEKYIPLDLIEKYSYRWDYYELSYNPNLTEKIILKYPNKDWDIEYLINNNKINNFKSLSKFKNINQKIINKYSDKLWDLEWLIENNIVIELERYIPFNLIEKYPYKWDYRYLSYHSGLTEEFILKYPNKDWNKDYLVKKFIFKKIFYKLEIK